MISHLPFGDGVTSPWGLTDGMGCLSTAVSIFPPDDSSFGLITTNRGVLANLSAPSVYTLDSTAKTASAADESLVKLLLSIIISCVLGGLAGLLGVVTNLVCVAVFWRQGFKDHVSITLMGLALSDLCCSLTMFWSAIGHTINNINPPPFLFEPFSLVVMTGTFPRVIFTRVTGWLTALIALERCVCVVLPFKVKVIFTPKNSSLMTSCLFIVVFTSHLFIYYSRTFQLAYNPRFNMSQVMMVNILERVGGSFYINAVIFIFLPLLNYAFILCCTVMMLWRLNMSTKWRAAAWAGTTAPHRRQKTPSENRKDTRRRTESRDVGARGMDVSRERRLTRMIATTTSVFIVCSTPSNVALSITLFISGLQYTGDNSVVYVTMHMFGVVMETINSSVGLFIYYRQSSKFRSLLLSMIPILQNKEAKLKINK